MKKIILITSLFFCLTLTTILAQITLDGNTTTSTTDVSGNILINIATPVNGLSNNTYREFNGDASYDIFFNNDASNPNFTDGDRASIIVNQVTSNSPSILEGRIQVSGHGAKIIIANPNGITCNGCYFVSVTGVDLVTGTYDIDNGTYSISDNDITLGSGGLAGSNLNIQTNNLNISSSGGVITDTLNLNLAGDFNNSGAILASFGINITATDFNNSGTITIDNEFNIAVDGFDITATNFTNSGTITVNGDLNATVDSFSNQAGATINATTDGCNIVYTTSYTDNGTSNCQNSVDGTIVFNIATPNSNGLSNNQVEDFDVATDGTILNNSASDGTAQLGGTAVTANSNITAGSEADLILFQVTGTSGSALNGTIEVFGSEAGLIIANPNGIACNACGFINTNRVDLVTGSGYDADTNTFSTIAAADIDITSSGLTASVLKIQTGADFINAGAINSDTVTIEVTNFANNIGNAGTVSSDSLNIILTDSFAHNSTSFSGFTNFSDLAITTDGTFTNNHTISLNGNLTITTDTFTNNAVINLTGGNLTIAADTFLNAASATITAGVCDIVATSYTDNGTITCINSLDDAMVIDIATPNNGFSNNSVVSFDVIADGTILNNSAVGGTTQFRSTDVEGNSNITAGSEADLILFQITGSTVSDLGGTIEVFGGEAGLIIANPNGIDCNGCFFINANRVDLVTGSGYDAGTNTFSTIAAADIDITSSGLTAPVLKVQTGANFKNAGAIVADTVTIEVTNFANDIENTGTISSASLNFILTANFTHSSTSFTGFNNFSNLAITTEGTFTNNANINSTGNTAITANTFINTGRVVNADTFALSVAGDFDYDEGTITANTTNLTVGGDFSYDDSANDFTWRENDSLVVSGNASVVVDDFANSGNITIANSGNFTANTFANSGGVLNADTFALSVAGNFDYDEGTITANTTNLTVGGDFSYDDSANDLDWGVNDSLVVSGNVNIVADDFENSGTITVTNNLNLTANTFAYAGGVFNADTLALSVAGDFDYDEGTITTNALNLDVGGNFSYDDSASDFTWRATDTLTVSGNANIVAAGFANSGTINITNIFNITAADFANSGIINATNIFDITATNFTNTSTISANSFNAIVDSFINQSGATITAGECNLVVHTSSSDNGTITCLNSEGDAEVVDIATPFNGLSRNDYTDFNIPINGVVFNNSDSDATSQLLGDISKNPNINSGNAASIILAQVSGTNSLLFGALEVVGAEAVVIIANPNGISCNGCSFINASRVDLVTGSDYNRTNDNFDNIANTNITIIENGLDASSVGILNIRAGSFTNTGVLNANIFNLFVDDFDYTEKGIINATIFNLEVDDVFSYEDESIGFVWEENDTLTVLGTANITTNNFINHGTIDITGSGSFEIITDYTAINQGSIVSENGSLNITTYDFFRNLTGGDIAVASLNIIAGGKVTNTATIDVATLSITASDDSSRTNDRTGFYVSNRGNIIATTLNITAVDNFYNRGNITATNFTTSAKSVFFLNKEIDSYDGTYDGGNIFLNGDSSFRADGGIIENYGNIDLGVFNLDITANSFTNHEGATIDAATLNLTVSSYINDGTVDAVVSNNGSIIDVTNDQ